MADTQQKSLKQIISEEYIKCASDVVYFLKRYCIIQHPKKGKIPFHLFPFQETTLQEVDSHRYSVILKCRQMGISTLVAGYCLHQMLFKSDFNILVIATTQDVAKNLVTKVRVMHENLPSWLRGTAIEDNKLSLKFKNGSQIKAVSSAGTSGRSEALSLLVIDEAAFIQRIDEIWASSQQTLATGGGAIVLSTPNGTGNFFHKKWQEAAEHNGKDGYFFPIKLHWTLHPEKDQKWRDEQDVLLGPKLAAQECDCLVEDVYIYVYDTELDIEEKLTIGEFYRRFEQLSPAAHSLSKTDIYKNTKYLVLTPDGYQPFKGIRKTTKQCYFYIQFDDGSELKCSDNHRLMFDGIELLASELKTGDVVNSSSGYTTVVSSEKIDGEVEVYDLIGVRNGNIYLTNNVISHNCDFMTSGNTVIDGPVLDWYKQTYICPPKETRGPGGDIWIWEYPDYSRSYLCTVDVARGDGSDFSSIQIFDIDSAEQVAEYKGQIGTTELGLLAIALATEYNNALVAVENTGIGWATVQILIDRQYPNIYYSYKDSGYIDNNKHLRNGYDMLDKSKMVPGFTTSTLTRPLMISKLEMYFRERTPIIKSERLYNELLVFIWNNGKAQAQNGFNDDLVMSFAMALYIRDTSLKLRQQGIDLTTKALNHINKNQGIYSVRTSAQNTWKQRIGNKDEDLTWLL